MIRSLFDDIEEEPQAKIETVNEPEVRTEPNTLPEEEMLPIFSEEDELSPEIPDLNNAATTIETTDLNDAATIIESADLNDVVTTIETTDLNDAVATIETPFMQVTETTSEILPPTYIPSLHDAEIIEEPVALPETPISHGAKTIDELRMQSNTANTRDPLTIPEMTNETVQVWAKPEPIAETSRRSGLAMSAAIALFGSVVFMLIIGWFADLLLGTSPWGKVGGIVVGSLIGFFQFFRMTSQIFKNKD